MNINNTILSQAFPRTFGPNLKFGDIVKVQFNSKKRSSGLFLYRNSSTPIERHSSWYDFWRVKHKWFTFTPHKNLDSAHGIFLKWEASSEYSLVYFPRLLKSGASCVLDCEREQIANHTDIIESKKLSKYILELTRLYADVDNFQIIETLSRHKHK